MSKLLIVISGPTASGKTDLSKELASNISGEIINADIGQFYAPFSIGTAKPDWKNEAIPHHMFDILDTPKDLSVVEYREFVLNKAEEIWRKNKTPILVGGSLFYLKSLYFPLSNLNLETEKTFCIPCTKNLTPWEYLNKIDPCRAKELHPNDLYRINRALEIWKQTGIKPSTYRPKYSPGFKSLFVFLSPQKQALHKRIDFRTEQMLENGWIEETKKALNTKWASFLQNKKLIGYPEIIEWLMSGEKKDSFEDLRSKIKTKTKQYAKKQITFWKMFKKLLEEEQKQSNFECKIIDSDQPLNRTLSVIISNLNV